MSRHNKDRRKYRCPCGNPFSTGQVETMEEAFARQQAMGVALPTRLVHSCGRCCKLSVREAGQMRYMTAAEEFRYRMDFPQAASVQDYAMKHDLPDCIGMIPLEKP